MLIRGKFSVVPTLDLTKVDTTAVSDVFGITITFVLNFFLPCMQVIKVFQFRDNNLVGGWSETKSI